MLVTHPTTGMALAPSSIKAARLALQKKRLESKPKKYQVSKDWSRLGRPSTVSRHSITTESKSPLSKSVAKYEIKRSPPEAPSPAPESQVSPVKGGASVPDVTPLIPPSRKYEPLKTNVLLPEKSNVVIKPVPSSPPKVESASYFQQILARLVPVSRHPVPEVQQFERKSVERSTCQATPADLLGKQLSHVVAELEETFRLNKQELGSEPPSFKSRQLSSSIELQDAKNAVSMKAWESFLSPRAFNLTAPSVSPPSPRERPQSPRTMSPPSPPSPRDQSRSPRAMSPPPQSLSPRLPSHPSMSPSLQSLSSRPESPQSPPSQSPSSPPELSPRSPRNLSPRLDVNLSPREQLMQRRSLRDALLKELEEDRQRIRHALSSKSFRSDVASSFDLEVPERIKTQPFSLGTKAAASQTVGSRISAPRKLQKEEQWAPREVSNIFVSKKETDFGVRKEILSGTTDLIHRGSPETPKAPKGVQKSAGDTNADGTIREAIASSPFPGMTESALQFLEKVGRGLIPSVPKEAKAVSGENVASKKEATTLKETGPNSKESKHEETASKRVARKEETTSGKRRIVSRKNEVTETATKKEETETDGKLKETEEKPEKEEPRLKLWGTALKRAETASRQEETTTKKKEAIMSLKRAATAVRETPPKKEGLLLMRMESPENAGAWGKFRTASSRTLPEPAPQNKVAELEPETPRRGGLRTLRSSKRAMSVRFSVTSRQASDRDIEIKADRGKPKISTGKKPEAPLEEPKRQLPQEVWRRPKRTLSDEKFRALELQKIREWAQRESELLPAVEELPIEYVGLETRLLEQLRKLLGRKLVTVPSWHRHTLVFSSFKELLSSATEEVEEVERILEYYEGRDRDRDRGMRRAKFKTGPPPSAWVGDEPVLTHRRLVDTAYTFMFPATRKVSARTKMVETGTSIGTQAVLSDLPECPMCLHRRLYQRSAFLHAADLETQRRFGRWKMAEAEQLLCIDHEEVWRHLQREMQKEPPTRRERTLQRKAVFGSRQAQESTDAGWWEPSLGDQISLREALEGQLPETPSRRHPATYKATVRAVREPSLELDFSALESPHEDSGDKKTGYMTLERKQAEKETRPMRQDGARDGRSEIAGKDIDSRDSRPARQGKDTDMGHMGAVPHDKSTVPGFPEKGFEVVVQAVKRDAEQDVPKRDQRKQKEKEDPRRHKDHLMASPSSGLSDRTPSGASRGEKVYQRPSLTPAEKLVQHEDTPLSLRKQLTPREAKVPLTEGKSQLDFLGLLSPRREDSPRKVEEFILPKLKTRVKDADHHRDGKATPMEKKKDPEETGKKGTEETGNTSKEEKGKKALSSPAVSKRDFDSRPGVNLGDLQKKSELPKGGKKEETKTEALPDAPILSSMKLGADSKDPLKLDDSLKKS
eukprot:Gregarina_sp_Poly_1__3976@NODE_21_length_20913_cov_102_783268_g19_i0_p1_GENE_NODE_21_length_20913_cov_102_783268_g19_i0NODE_21_length_20913_cov_102_783268_g19_i0_p1_ORF_typecomplete_len1397_score283_54_NODE_21_length_20913_cov_102_783268_g19_i0609010280